MLIHFKVANYKSIKDPIVINFNAASLSEHTETNIINEGNLSLLKSIVIYGHNASGKSKIMDAFAFFRYYIINSAIEKQGSEPIPVECFALNKDTENKPSYFEACFLINHIKYRYGFEADKERIHKEWLLESKVTKEYPVYLRIGDAFEVDYKRFDNAEGIDKKTRKNALFISAASQWNVGKAALINDWFSGIFVATPVSHDMYTVYSNFTIDMMKSKRYMSVIKALLKDADLGIEDIELRDDSVNRVHTLHKRYDKQNELVDTVHFYLDKHESDGTRKFFNIIGMLISAIYDNKLVVMDEFDARLHTLLTKAILKLFNTGETKSTAQLLVTSHDTALLDRSILRRDQIYFVEKNSYGASEITSLVEYKPRKESPYDRNYLEGKYGAIPMIGEFEEIISNG